MSFIKKIWKDPVGSKLISAFIIAVISSVTWVNWQELSSFILKIPTLVTASTIIPNWIFLLIILLIIAVLLVVLSGRKKPAVIQENDTQLTKPPSRELSPEKDLNKRLESAKDKIIFFGLDRNHYTPYKMRNLLENKSRDVPIRLYLMDPSSKSRKDRVRIEPYETSKEDFSRLEKEIAGAYQELLSRTDRSPAGSKLPGLSIYYYNFPCSYSIELIDDVCRIMLFGHGKRGSDSPILIFDKTSVQYDYFASQIEWIEEIASGKISSEWDDKKIKIEPFK